MVKIRLGKREYRHDARTLQLSAHLAAPEDIEFPDKYDFDARRRPFPVTAWGNNRWGNCVMAGRANQAVRIERVEHKRTPLLTESQVIEAYQREVEREFGVQTVMPGDANDQGLIVLEALKQWRSEGWPLRYYRWQEYSNETIAAFGELENDTALLRAAIYLLRGVQLGFMLPQTAAVQIDQGQPWDIVPGNAPDTQPGSWGGHLVYAKRYDEDFIYVLTWGKEVPVTDRFMSRYCDERWAVVDNLEINSPYLDVNAMLQRLHSVGAITPLEAERWTIAKN